MWFSEIKLPTTKREMEKDVISLHKTLRHKICESHPYTFKCSQMKIDMIQNLMNLFNQSQKVL
jgi:hypothetical protein